MGPYSWRRGGGNALSALDVAEYIESEVETIHISALCMSACAEIILLSQVNVEMFNLPVIGFHHNSIILDALAEALGDRGVCASNNLWRFRTFQQRRGVAVDAWRHQMEMLDYEVEALRGRKDL